MSLGTFSMAGGNPLGGALRECGLIMEYLKSERIILRPLLMKDARDVFSYRSDSEINQFQTWQPKTIADVEEFIETRIVGEPNLPETWLSEIVVSIF
jgi:RimJ/RimL family protein N-acetyltransferase